MVESVNFNDIEKNLTLYRTVMGEDPLQDKYILVDGDNTDSPVMDLSLGADCRFLIIENHDVTEDFVSLSDKLDDLALQVIEANQQGVDINDTTNDYTKPEKVNDPCKIRKCPYKFPLSQIYDLIKERELMFSHNLEEKGLG